MLTTQQQQEEQRRRDELAAEEQRQFGLIVEAEERNQRAREELARQEQERANSPGRAYEEREAATRQSDQARQQAEAQQSQQDFNPADYVEVGINKPMGQSEFIKKEDAERVKKESPILYDQLKRDGVSAYNQSAKTEFTLKAAEVKESERKQREADTENKKTESKNKDIEAENTRRAFVYESELLNIAHAADAQMAALDKLKTAKNTDGTFDFDKLASFARTTKDAESVFKGANFEDAKNLMDDIKKYNDAPVDFTEFRRRYLLDNNIEDKAKSAMEINSYKYLNPKSKEFKELQASVALNDEIGKAYRDKYGAAVQTGDVAGAVLQPIFPPARALKPDVVIKDISGLEWAVGVAQVGLLAIPGVGLIGGTAARLAVLGIQAAAGGVFTYQTVKEWDNMSNTERSMSVAIDALIIAGAGGSALGLLKGAKLNGLKGKASNSAEKAITRLADEHGGGIKIDTKAVKELSKALSDKDVNAMLKAGKSIEAQGKAAKSAALEAQGRFIQDKAGEIVKIAEQRLNAKQAADLTKRLRNNLDFVESPGQKLIAKYDKLNSGIARTKKEIADYESLIKKADIELEKGTPKVKKSTMTRAQIEAERTRLTQQISRDNAQYGELINKGGQPGDLQRIKAQMDKARAELAELDVKPDSVSAGKLKQTAQDEIRRLNRQLAEQVKQRQALLESDTMTKLYGAKIAGTERAPGEPLQRGKTDKAPERGGKVATIEKVERKVKVKEVEPDLDKLKKAKEKLAEQTKTTTKTATKTSTRTGTGEPVTIPQPKPTGPVKVLVWENGRIYLKTIKPKQLTEGMIRPATADQRAIQQRYETLSKKIGKDKAASKLAREFPGRANYPVIVSQNKAATKTASESVTPEPFNAPTPTPQQSPQPQPEASRAQPEKKPTPTPKPEPRPKPYPSIGTGTKTSTKPKERIKPKGGSDKDKRQFIKDSLGAITYRRGKLQDHVWHTFALDANGQVHRVTLQGAAPAGAVLHTGKGSTAATLRKIRGKVLPNMTARVNTGVVDDIVSVSGGKLTMAHVSDKAPAISERTPRISNRGMRISPPMPRLTPRMPRLR